MKLFGKKREEGKSCCCGGNCTPETMAQAEAKKGEGGIKILGSGCAKCNALEAAAREALGELGMDTSIDHVTDFTQIAAYGVMTTPALVAVSYTHLDVYKRQSPHPARSPGCPSPLGYRSF